MKVIIACEFSGTVRDAFLAQGHDAISCDILPTEKPGPHIEGDIREVDLSSFDMMIAHPPCTYLSYAGVGHWKNYDAEQKKRQEEAYEFFLWFNTLPIKHIAIENPVGLPNTRYRKPDQIIHPYMFGHNEQKRTCLWLKNLPPLMSTLNCVCHKEFVNSAPYKGEERRIYRSRTFKGIAEAMAQQWT